MSAFACAMGILDGDFLFTILAHSVCARYKRDRELVEWRQNVMRKTLKIALYTRTSIKSHHDMCECVRSAFFPFFQILFTIETHKMLRSMLFRTTKTIQQSFKKTFKKKKPTQNHHFAVHSMEIVPFFNAVFNLTDDRNNTLRHIYSSWCTRNDERQQQQQQLKQKQHKRQVDCASL